MIGNALLAATLLMITLVFYLMQECAFLIPYRHLLWSRYAAPIAVFAAALFFNLFAAIYVGCRKFLLKDTGRKLAHLEKQLRTGDSLSEELANRLND